MLDGIGWSMPDYGRCTMGRDTHYPLYLSVVIDHILMWNFLLKMLYITP